jgi:hypothetical protein
MKCTTCAHVGRDVGVPEANCSSELVLAASQECVDLVVALLGHDVLASLGFCCSRGATCNGVAGPGEHNAAFTAFSPIRLESW